MSRPSTFTGNVDLDDIRNHADYLKAAERHSAAARLYACAGEIERLRAKVTQLQEREEDRDPPSDRD